MNVWSPPPPDQTVKPDPMPWTIALALAAWVVLCAWVLLRAPGPTPEVGPLAPIIVDARDPFPCEQDPEKRLFMQERGIICSPWPDPWR